jgi:hypothetical protein
VEKETNFILDYDVMNCSVLFDLKYLTFVWKLLQIVFYMLYTWNSKDSYVPTPKITLHKH